MLYTPRGQSDSSDISNQYNEQENNNFEENYDELPGLGGEENVDIEMEVADNEEGLEGNSGDDSSEQDDEDNDEDDNKDENEDEELYW